MTNLIELAERVEKASGADRRILDRLDRRSECWLWTGALDSRGRGRVWRDGKITIHHRAVWEILVGPIPQGALLCHHCDNPTCANPTHLYVGDGKTNVRDMFSRGRHWTQREPERARAVGVLNGAKNDWARGESNPKARLTADQVSEIAASADKTKLLAARYGVNRTTIQRIRRGAAWN